MNDEPQEMSKEFSMTMNSGKSNSKQVPPKVKVKLKSKKEHEGIVGQAYLNQGKNLEYLSKIK